MLASNVNLVTLKKGWSRSSINTTIFRYNSISSFGDIQVVGFYDTKRRLTLAQRKINESEWEFNTLSYKGKTRDSHNVITLMHDAKAYLHVAWDHHNHPLRYTRSVTPESIELQDKISMTGVQEKKVCYPEFYHDRNGDILFFYRTGGSGHGNLNVKKYNAESREWSDTRIDLIHGGDERNPYWQVAVDVTGAIHVSWVWRETGDASTNHDICYAKSTDGGKTWHSSKDVPYSLPITVDNAEVIVPISQGRNLINTGTMATDSKGKPYITMYWQPRNEAIPQYMLVYQDSDNTWQSSKIIHQSIPFDLEGRGSLKIPISRPRILIDRDDHFFVLFRAVDRGSRVSIAGSTDLRNWVIKDLTEFPVGEWEPSIDSKMWNEQNMLHLYVQNVKQRNHGGNTFFKHQLVTVLEWDPIDFFNN